MIADDEPDVDLALLLTRLGQVYFFHETLRWQPSAPSSPSIWLRRLRPRKSSSAAGTYAARSSVGGAPPRRADYSSSATTQPLLTALSAGRNASALLSDLAIRRDRTSTIAHLEQMMALSRKVGHRAYGWFGLSEMSHALTSRPLGRGSCAAPGDPRGAARNRRQLISHFWAARHLPTPGGR